MAPSSGHILVPKAVKAFKYAVSQGAAFLRSRLQQESSKPILEVIPVRINKQPLHPLAALRLGRSQQRNFSTAVRRIISGATGPTTTARPAARAPVRTALSRSTFAPFSSPLRPNLTGGALPRASGGYSLGGNVRHFSHTPAAQAQVLNNVSAAMRAFCVNGYKAQYDGVDPRTGNKRYRAVTATQEKAIAKLRSAKPHNKGTTLEFCIAPTITAVSPLEKADTYINSEPVISGLASDFARSLAALSQVHADIKRLSTLGSLPISQPNAHTLQVRFPGCDAAIVNSLCDELGIRRGIIKEDPEWDAFEGDKDVGMALLFPWAPSCAASEISDQPRESYFFQAPPPPEALGPRAHMDWQSMLSVPSATSHAAPSISHDDFSLLPPSRETASPNPWLEPSSSSVGGEFDALRESDVASDDEYGYEGLDLTRTETARQTQLWQSQLPREPSSFADFEGTEGILRFLEVCDEARR